MIRRLARVAAIALACAIAATPAFARHHHHHKHKHHHHVKVHRSVKVVEASPCIYDNNGRVICTQFGTFTTPVRHDANGNRISRNEGWNGPRRFSDPRPHAWCGWWMRQTLGVANRAYNLARNWAHYGSPAGGPRVGAIVVWPHHVGLITGQTSDGTYIVKSGNDGHAVRERPRSLRGAIAFRMASL